MGRHIPHVYVAPPWGTDPLPLTEDQVRHLSRVLRIHDGDSVRYTDGLGQRGRGRMGGDVILRGDETTIRRPSTVAMAVSPLKSVDRTRFIVEKLQELGVASLSWLLSHNTQGAAPHEGKARAWAIGALEQSRGAWLMDLRGSRTMDGRDQLMDGRGDVPLDPGATLCVGPEGGWSQAEIGDGLNLVGLGPTVLRTETAALVAASRAISKE